MGLLEKIIRNWFLIGIVAVIFLAYIEPSIGIKGGILKPEITIKYFAVSIIFFNSGLSLKTEQLAAAIKQYKIHIFIQLFTFIFIPLFIFCLKKVLYLTDISIYLLHGLTVLSCMPPPVSSAVILTKAIGGNEAAAIFNSAFGSFLGIFVSPMLLLFMLGNSGDVPVMKVFKTLTCTVVLPIILGQKLRRNDRVRLWLEEKKPPFGQIGSAILLAIIYTTFCDTFGSGNLNIDMYSLVSIIGIIISIQLFMTFLTFKVSRNLGVYSPADTVCIMFCSTHKSLTLGIPMLKIIYAGNKSLSFLSIPLLVYHPCQILVGGLLVNKVRDWMVKAENSSLESKKLLDNEA